MLMNGMGPMTRLMNDHSFDFLSLLSTCCSWYIPGIYMRLYSHGCHHDGFLFLYIHACPIVLYYSHRRAGRDSRRDLHQQGIHMAPAVRVPCTVSRPYTDGIHLSRSDQHCYDAAPPL